MLKDGSVLEGPPQKLTEEEPIVEPTMHRSYPSGAPGLRYDSSRSPSFPVPLQAPSWAHGPAYSVLHQSLSLHPKGRDVFSLLNL